MKLAEVSVRHHVFAYMMSGVLVLFGLISYERIGVDRFPAIDFPMLSITTVLPGADPSVLDASVTNVIESAVNSVSGIESIQSSSLPGVSAIRIQFVLEKDIDVAFNEVQSKVNQILRELPKDTESPVVSKVEVGGAPIMWLVVQGDRTLQQLNRYARNQLKKRLETVSGVGEVVIGGERRRTIRIELDIERMAMLEIGVQDVVSAFRREHLKLPGGFLTSAGKEDQIKLDLEYHNLEALKTLIVAWRGDLPVRLHEIAEVKDGLADERRFASYDSQPAVGLGIVKISNANSVAILEEVKRRLEEEILPQLPPGTTLEIASDDTRFIITIVNALQEHLIEGTLLAAFVVWLFLKSLRSTVIIATAIPVSLLGAVAAMYFAGYTFNIMTLLGLLLLIGVVVDDAIVVLESIHRQREKNTGGDARVMAIAGTAQVMLPVLASTFTLVAIFASVVFMGGIIGRFIQPFAVVATLGVLISTFVALTLTPMLCSRYLRIVSEPRGLYRWFEIGFRRIEATYGSLLRAALHYRWTVIIITLAVVSTTGYFMGQLGKGFMPDEDESRFIVTFKTPLGSSISYTRDRLQRIEEVLGENREINGLFSTIGTGALGRVNQGEIFVRLVPPENRERRQSEILAEIRERLAAIPGVRAFASPVPMIGGQRGEPLQFVLKGPDLLRVAELAEQLESRLRAIPEMGSLDKDLELATPELRLLPDRSMAEDLGLTSHDIAEALRVVGGGLDVAKYNDEPGDGERYDIRLKAREGSLQNQEDLRRIYLRNRDGELIRLDQVARFEPGLGAAVISRYNLQYSATFFLTPTIAEGDAAEVVLEEADRLLPPGYGIELVGRAKEFSLFGALLNQAGAGGYFIKIAFSLLGHMRGGPAKAAVISSAMTGMISGSSIANVVTTGTFTIPLMRRVGFSAEKAGAVEVSSSVNGVLTPPVMGAVAFLMTEYVGIPYIEVVKTAIVPALISYLALVYIVHLEAVKAGMEGLPRSTPPSPLKLYLLRTGIVVTSFIILCAAIYYAILGVKLVFGDLSGTPVTLLVIAGYVWLVWLAAKVPDLELDDPNSEVVKLPVFSEIYRSGLYYIVPIVVLIWFLIVERKSPAFSAFWATLFLLFILVTQKPLKSLFRRTRDVAGRCREGLSDLLEGVVTGARNMIGLAAAMGVAGIIVGAVTLTGIGQVMAEFVEFLSGGNLLAMLFFVALISIVLGMGLPTTANYIVVSSLMAGVVVELGAQSGLIVPLVAVHMFCFYYGIMADVTPPVGLASFAAAAISQGDPLRTGVQAFFYSLRTALLPFLFIFNTDLLLIDVGPVQAIFVFIVALTAMLLFAAGTMGWFLTRSRLWESAALLIVAFVLFRPGLFLDQIAPPFETRSASEIYELAEATPDGGSLKVRLVGESLEGAPIDSTFLLPLGASGANGPARLSAGAGLDLRDEEGTFIVDNLTFGGPAEQLGIDFDWRVASIEVAADRLPKEVFYLPALLLLGLVVVVQRRRHQNA